MDTLKLSRRVLIGGLMTAPALASVRPGYTGPKCDGRRSGAVRSLISSTVCDFATHTTADGTASDIAFNDFKIKKPRRGVTEKQFDARHTFAHPKRDEPIYLRNVALDGALDSEGVSGLVILQVRVGRLRLRRSWRLEDGENNVSFESLGRQRLHPGTVFPIVVRAFVRVRQLGPRSLFSLSIDSLRYVHGPLLD